MPVAIAPRQPQALNRRHTGGQHLAMEAADNRSVCGQPATSAAPFTHKKQPDNLEPPCLSAPRIVSSEACAKWETATSVGVAWNITQQMQMRHPMLGQPRRQINNQERPSQERQPGRNRIISHPFVPEPFLGRPITVRLRRRRSTCILSFLVNCPPMIWGTPRRCVSRAVGRNQSGRGQWEMPPFFRFPSLSPGHAGRPGVAQPRANPRTAPKGSIQPLRLQNPPPPACLSLNIRPGRERPDPGAMHAQKRKT